MIFGNILYILLAVALLGVLVTVHEFGHYVAGRLTGIPVVEFAISFGPKLLKWRRKETDYSLRAFPLGGFCKFLGEDEDSPDPRAMNRQKVWKRFLTVLSGPLMNFVFAFVVVVVLLMGYYTAESYPRIAEVYENTPAAAAGLQPGDVIVEMNGEAIAFDDASVYRAREIIAATEPEEPVSVVVDRSGERTALSIMPEIEVTEQGNVYRIGIAFDGRNFNLGEALAEAPNAVFNTVSQMLAGLRNMVFKGEGLGDVGGPVAIIHLVSEVAREGLYMVLSILFIISLNLGIFNLLPIPALDGGRLMFLLLEGIRRKPVPPEKEGLVHGIGFMLLIGFIVFVTYRDILRLVTG